MSEENKTKFCKYCGAVIAEDAVICTACGRQVEELRSEPPQIIINNENNNVNANVNAGIYGRKLCNKWVSLCLCIFLGVFGAHKFYEEKAGMGILYLFTCGLFGIGLFIDFFVILFKPHYYYA